MSNKLDMSQVLYLNSILKANKKKQKVVAMEAGVAESLVSDVLNGNKYSKKVVDTILGYVPDGRYVFQLVSKQG